MEILIKGSADEIKSVFLGECADDVSDSDEPTEKIEIEEPPSYFNDITLSGVVLEIGANAFPLKFKFKRIGYVDPIIIRAKESAQIYFDCKVQTGDFLKIKVFLTPDAGERGDNGSYRFVMLDKGNILEHRRGVKILK